MPPTLIFDFLSTRVMGKQAEALDLKMRFIFDEASLPDSERNLYVRLKNGVLHSKNNKPDMPTTVTYTITRSELLEMFLHPPDRIFGQFAKQLALQPDRVWNIVLPLSYDNSGKNSDPKP